jgi:hypothetical protein
MSDFSRHMEFNRKGIPGHFLFIKIMCHAHSQLHTSLLHICLFPWPWCLVGHAWSISNLMTTVTITFQSRGKVLGNYKLNIARRGGVELFGTPCIGACPLSVYLEKPWVEVSSENSIFSCFSSII